MRVRVDVCGFFCLFYLKRILEACLHAGFSFPIIFLVFFNGYVFDGCICFFVADCLEISAAFGCYGEQADFLSIDNQQWDGDIVTNPPYAYAQEFVEKALAIIPEGHKVCMFLKLTFLEGKKRKHLFQTQPPARIWVSSSRLLCAMNGEFDKLSGSATAYAWFVWEKGYKGDTVIKWFN